MAAKSTDSTKKVAVPNYLEMLNQAGEAWLAQVTEMQDNSLKFLEKVSEGVMKNDAFAAPKIDAAQFGLPSARELIEANFAIMDRYIANQRAYVDQLLKVSGS